MNNPFLDPIRREEARSILASMQAEIKKYLANWDQKYKKPSYEPTTEARVVTSDFSKSTVFVDSDKIDKEEDPVMDSVLSESTVNLHSGESHDEEAPVVFEDNSCVATVPVTYQREADFLSSSYTELTNPLEEIAVTANDDIREANLCEQVPASPINRFTALCSIVEAPLGIHINTGTPSGTKCEFQKNEMINVLPACYILIHAQKYRVQSDMVKRTIAHLVLGDNVVNSHGYIDCTLLYDMNLDNQGSVMSFICFDPGITEILAAVCRGFQPNSAQIIPTFKWLFQLTVHKLELSVHQCRQCSACVIYQSNQCNIIPHVSYSLCSTKPANLKLNHLLAAVNIIRMSSSGVVYLRSVGCHSYWTRVHWTSIEQEQVQFRTVDPVWSCQSMKYLLQCLVSQVLFHPSQGKMQMAGGKLYVQVKLLQSTGLCIYKSIDVVVLPLHYGNEVVTVNNLWPKMVIHAVNKVSVQYTIMQCWQCEQPGRLVVSLLGQDNKELFVIQIILMCVTSLTTYSWIEDFTNPVVTTSSWITLKEWPPPAIGSHFSDQHLNIGTQNHFCGGTIKRILITPSFPSTHLNFKNDSPAFYSRQVSHICSDAPVSSSGSVMFSWFKLVYMCILRKDIRGIALQSVHVRMLLFPCESNLGRKSDETFYIGGVINFLRGSDSDNSFSNDENARLSDQFVQRMLIVAALYSIILCITASYSTVICTSSTSRVVKDVFYVLTVKSDQIVVLEAWTSNLHTSNYSDQHIHVRNFQAFSCPYQSYLVVCPHGCHTLNHLEYVQYNVQIEVRYSFVRMCRWPLIFGDYIQPEELGMYFKNYAKFRESLKCFTVGIYHKGLWLYNVRTVSQTIWQISWDTRLRVSAGRVILQCNHSPFVTERYSDSLSTLNRHDLAFLLSTVCGSLSNSVVMHVLTMLQVLVASFTTQLHGKVSLHPLCVRSSVVTACFSGDVIRQEVSVLVFEPGGQSADTSRFRTVWHIAWTVILYWQARIVRDFLVFVHNYFWARGHWVIITHKQVAYCLDL